MKDPNDCEPCTSYATWMGPGDGQFKQDDDGKCWSTNEQGSSNGLHLCYEFSGFNADAAPWSFSDTVSCWAEKEEGVLCVNGEENCYSFDEAVEKYFGAECENEEQDYSEEETFGQSWGVAEGWC